MNLEAFFKLTYGLFIVAAKKEDKINGYCSNTITQVTAEPPQIVVCCHKNNLTCEYILASNAFSISVLSQDAHPDIIGTFGFKSGRDTNKFDGFKYIYGNSGMPILTQDCVAWFECELVNTVDVGTHYMFIGKVIDNDLLDKDKDALTYKYYRDKKRGFSPKNSPTYIDKEELAAEKSKSMTKGIYECCVCGYRYDPAIGDEVGGIEPGIKFGDLPDNWVCPVCGASKEEFKLVE